MTQTQTCGYCSQAPADPGYDRCTPCRTWRDEEWCEINGVEHGVEPVTQTQRVILTVTLPNGTVLDSYPHVIVPSLPKQPIRMADHAILKIAENVRALAHPSVTQTQEDGQ